jgi:hypothetical protein
LHQTHDRTERLEIYERLGIQYARKHSFITDAAIAQAKDTVKREQIEAKARAAIEEAQTVEASLKSHAVQDNTGTPVGWTVAIYNPLDQQTKFF